MPNFRKSLPFLAISAGALLVLLGLALIGFYIVSVAATFDQPDRSVIFWYLVFPLTGMPLTGLGMYFVLIGFKSRREPDRYLGRVKYSLIALGGLALLVGALGIFDEFRTDRRRKAMVRQEANRTLLLEEMHGIARVAIDGHDGEGFTFSAVLTPGLPGSYRLDTEISSSQALFLRESRSLELNGRGTTITRYIPFEQLFQKCAGPFRDANIYVCIENTGAKSLFTIESRLFLTRAEKGTFEGVDKPVQGPMSTGKTGFSLDTFTGPQGVGIDRFQPVDR